MDNNTLFPGIEEEKKTEKEQFKKPSKDGKVEFIVREVDEFDFDGFEAVRREWFSKLNCPAVTFSYGKVRFNIRIIEKLDYCTHILILINIEKKLMQIVPSDENEKDSLQWSRIDKKGKLVPKMITGKEFTARLYEDLSWHLKCTSKILGELIINKRGQKVFEFNLMNAEKYRSISEPTADNPKRRRRVAFSPQLWEENYGQSYDELQAPKAEFFDDVPDGYVQIVLPKLPTKKAVNKAAESENTIEKSANTMVYGAE